MGKWAPRTVRFTLGAYTLYEIDYLEVSLLYLFHKIWANGPPEQHDDFC